MQTLSRQANRGLAKASLRERANVYFVSLLANRDSRKSRKLCAPKAAQRPLRPPRPPPPPPAPTRPRDCATALARPRWRAGPGEQLVAPTLAPGRRAMATLARWNWPLARLIRQSDSNWPNWSPASYCYCLSCVRPLARAAGRLVGQTESHTSLQALLLASKLLHKRKAREFGLERAPSSPARSLVGPHLR